MAVATEQKYPAGTTEMVLIDVLKDFLTDDGKFNPMIRPMLDEVALIPTLEQVLAARRAAGLTVAYAPDGLDEHGFDGFRHLHPQMQMQMQMQIRMGMDNRLFGKAEPDGCLGRSGRLAGGLSPRDTGNSPHHTTPN